VPVKLVGADGAKIPAAIDLAVVLVIPQADIALTLRLALVNPVL
jgi:hypothetical protein